MALWSITCWVPISITIPEASQVLERGINAFTVTTNNVEPILDRIRSAGGNIVKNARLDDYESITPALE
jgi:hypothetical protein